MEPGSLPIRLVICIDGTYCTADGPDGKGHGNISNVYRICASVKQGQSFDEVKRQVIFQKTQYEEGIGSADEVGSWDRFKAGVWGHGFKATIKKVYKECCKLNARDEVWLYGFSRGAYIARAVAGLLHYIGALTSAEGPQFEAEYSRALAVYGNSEQRSRIGPGQVCYRLRNSATLHLKSRTANFNVDSHISFAQHQTETNDKISRSL